MPLPSTLNPSIKRLPKLDAQLVLTRLCEVCPDPVAVTEFHGGRFHMVNGAFERMFGYAQEELRGRRATDIDLWFDPPARERYGELLTLTGGQVHDYAVVFRARDGRPVPLRVSASTFEQNGVRYVVSALHDVTERERGRLQYEAILNNAVVGVAFVRDRAFQHTNPQFDEMFGWPRDGLAKLPGRVLWPDDASYVAVLRRAARVLAVGDVFDHDCEMQRRDGSRVWCKLRARAIDLDNPVRGGTIWIVDDITQRRQIDRALAAAKEQAEAANRAKSAFLANTSHEIRTPLNGLLGLARLALAPEVTPSRQREYLERIHESAQALAGTMSDILDFSKIEAGRMAVDKLPFDLHAMLGHLRDSHAELAAAKGLAFRLSIGDGVPAWVHGDAMRLRQIVGNFLGNALKFTEKGLIEVTVHACRGNRLRIEVHDTGLGIASSAMHRLFVPFSQADASTTRQFGGTGLGLSICRELATLMQGEVGVDSIAGEGSVFWVELPLPPAEALDEPASTLLPGADALRGARILLVEDNPINTLVAEATLKQWGADVTLAEHGAEAVDAVMRADGDFDVVLMDLQMPVMNGFEAATRIRKRHDAEQLPIVALTADVLLSERTAALGHGMNDFLSKPIDPDRLVRVLAHWVRRARAARG
jgi:PAS domain S-box-containing protein